MTSESVSGTVTWLSVCFLAAVTIGCSGKANPAPDHTEPPPMSPVLSAFEKDPSADTWDDVHQEILKGYLTPYAESRIITFFSTRNVSPAIVNAAAVDLSSNDFSGAIKFLHQENLVAQINPPPNANAVLKKTSYFTWLLLALRSNYDKSGVDLTRMDLTTGADFVGQAMNLVGVDFSAAKLPGGTWRVCDLTGALFNSVSTRGKLVCLNCQWGTVRASLRLADGKWIPLQ
jgi:hypothetical protein